mmetsp:Transcript_90854/g.261784  ORF Transcript_90854/g.261784 Transcript_90854/m.261784 type:complete len:361 (-) Transcript_90854:263-1345(-)
MRAVLALAAVSPIVSAGPDEFLQRADANVTAAAATTCALYECTGCGSCFNPGARPGIECKGRNGMTGYYCPPDMDGGAGDMAYACLDWTFGSTAMKAAEAEFLAETGDDVFFGIGTYGTSADPQSGLGACFRLRVQGMKKDIIAQSINTGHDVAGNQFDVQMGAGGAGAYNTCSGESSSMFPGRVEDWGCQYGGIDSREACANLPKYPRMAASMRAAGESLVELCEYSFDMGARMSGAGLPAGECKYNPTLLDVGRVRCPAGLVNLTQMQRVDEPETYTITNSSRPLGFPNSNHECRTWDPASDASYCLTRMMDCRKPSGGFTTNVRSHLMVPGKKVLQVCAADGYTRYDVQCGCKGCYC